MIDRPSRSRLVPDWVTAGKVYLDYAHLTEEINRLRLVEMRSINGVWFSAGFDDVLNLCLLQNDDLTAAKIEAALEGLKPEVTSLCQRVAQIRCFTAHDRLARAGKRVHA